MTDATQINRIGLKLILLSLVKLAFYIIAGLFVGYLIGKMPDVLSILNDDGELSATGLSIRDLLVNIVPENIFSPFHNNNVLQIIFLAVFFGIIINKSGKNSKWAKDGIDFLTAFTMNTTEIISKIIPLFVATSMIDLMITVGFSGIFSYAKLLIATAAGLPLCFLVSALMVIFIGRISPLPFLKKIIPFSALPFSLSSSNACMPQTISFCSQKFGMDEKITKFSIPVGMQFNMDGTAYYFAVVSMILIQTFEIATDFEFFVSLFFTEFFLALTGIGLLVMPSMLLAVGIPEIAIMPFIGLEPIRDMFGTAQNVVGNITAAFLTAKNENQVDIKSYKNL